MSEDELHDLICTLVSSGFADGERKGLGAKIAALNVSPWGLLYETWNGVDPPVRGILRLDHEARDCGWALDASGRAFTNPPVKSLHPVVRAAGHGTTVVLLGESDADDTFTRYREELGRTKAFSYFANFRYGEFPDGLRVAMAAPRSKKKDPYNVDHRTVDVVGMGPATIHNADEHGVWHGEGYDVLWAYTKDLGHAKGRRFTHGDNCVTRQVVTVAIGDVEVPGLWENYDVHTGLSARTLLAEFGVGTISNHVSIQVRIHDRERLGVSTNVERTQLVVDAKPLDLKPLAAAFRDDMPARLEEILLSDIAERSVDYRDEIEKTLLRDADLYLPPTPPRGDGPTGGFGGNGSTGGDGPPGGPKTGTGGRPGTPGTGDGRGGWGARGSKGLAKVNISTAVWLASDRSPDEEGAIARYDQQNRVLEVDHDCWLIEEEVSLVMRERGLRSTQDRLIVKEAIVYLITMSLMEGILRIERARQLEHVALGDYSWDFGLTPQGLTAMVAPLQLRKSGVTLRLRGKLGSKVR